MIVYQPSVKGMIGHGTSGIINDSLKQFYGQLDEEV